MAHFLLCQFANEVVDLGPEFFIGLWAHVEGCLSFNIKKLHKSKDYYLIQIIPFVGCLNSESLIFFPFLDKS